MGVDVPAERASEWAYVRAGLVLAVLLVVGWTLGWLVDDSMRDEPTALELTVRCLENEKGLPVILDVRDPIARSAGRGALSTTVEGNPVTVVIGSSSDDAARVERAYRAVGDVEGRIEQRGHIVYVFERPPSPTQRQGLYDCAYE